MQPDEINNRLFSALQSCLYAERQPVGKADVHALAEACGFTPDEAFPFVLAEAMGLRADTDPLDRYLLERVFPRMLRKCDPVLYASDPYYRTVAVPSIRAGQWELCTEQYAPYEIFVCGDMSFSDDGLLIPPIGWFDTSFPYPAVLEDGREWMLITPNEIETMRPVISSVRGNVLTFGLGMGYFAFMAAEKPDVRSVTVIERDPNVIALFTRYLLPSFPHKEKIHVIRDDAFRYAETSLAPGMYDHIFTDLWHDAGDGIELYQRMKRLEYHAPGSVFHYWIEPTLLSCMRF